MKRTPLRRKTPLSKNYRPQKAGKLPRYHRLKNSLSQLKRKRIPVRSARRERDEKEYRKLTPQFLKDNPVCQRMRCFLPSTEVHHKAKRELHYLNVATWMACCSGCHRDIEKDRKWAEANGYTYTQEQVRLLGDFDYWDAIS